VLAALFAAVLQRFATPAMPTARPGAERASAQRMYYMAGHLDTSAQAPDGRRYLTGFRLQVGGAALGEVPAIR
jgi:hypothetical protein